MWRKIIGWALLVVGLGCFAGGLAWAVIVWEDDEARMAAAGAMGGLMIAGICGIVFGAMTLLKGDGGSWDPFGGF